MADKLIELANRVFGLSTDAILKSVKKFLDKGVRTIMEEAYKSLACRNLCTITGIVVAGYWASWPDTGQHRSSAKKLISQWKRKQSLSSC